MEADSQVLFDLDGNIARITINRPDKRNALNVEVMQLLRDAVARAKAEQAARVVVITGAGDKAFSAGGDLGGFAEGQGKVEQHIMRGALADLFEDMARLGKPIIARVNGHALAGGFGLMCGCDFAIAVDDAQFGMPEINIGLWPFIISVVVRRAMAERKVLELMMTGERFDAAEAERLGVLNKVVARDQLDTAVNELCEALASKSPLIMRLGKDSFYASRDMTLRQALDYLHGQLAVALESEDMIEGITAFMQKRAPEWKGR